MYRPAPFLLLILLLLAQPLLAQPLLAESDPKVLEARLETAASEERLAILVDLASHYRKADPNRTIAAATEALELLETHPDRSRQIEILLYLSEAHLNLRENDVCLSYASRAESLATSFDDPSIIARVRYHSARAYRNKLQSERAIDLLLEAKDLFERAGNHFLAGQSLRRVGNILLGQGNLKKALEVYIEAYEWLLKLKDPLGIATVLNDIGTVHHSLGNYHQALDYYQQAMEVYRREGARKEFGITLNNIGGIYIRLDRHEEALDLLLESLEIREALGLAGESVLNMLGRAYGELGELEPAKRYYRRGLQEGRRIGDKVAVAANLEGLAWILQQQGDLPAALESAKEALDTAREIGARRRIHMVQLLLSKIYIDLGRHREALDMFKRHSETRSEMFNEENSRVVAEMRARFEAGQKEKEIELLEQRQAVSTLELERQRGTRRALVLGFSLVSLIALLLFNRYRLKSREVLMLETVRQERKVSTQLREINKLKDEFLANTSHELRTPLYGITGLAESLIDGATGPLPEATNSHLSMIVSSGRRLGRLIEDILDVSKLAHQSLRLEKRPVDLHALADVVVTLLAPLAESKGLEIVSSISAELPAADADENRLEQILHNLVGNAIKFTDSGRVEVMAEALEDRLIVTVEDTGIGIARDKLGTIFDAFEQVDSSVQRKFGGTGLGLTVTRKLVELHGGSLGVASEVGQGTRFFFNLPSSPESPQTGSPQTASAEQGVAGEQPVSRPVASEPARVVPLPEPAAAQTPPQGAEKILVVDDEPVNLQVLSNHLACEGYEIELAASGQEGLSLLQEKAFDLMILDVMMPKTCDRYVDRNIRLLFWMSVLASGDGGRPRSCSIAHQSPQHVRSRQRVQTGPLPPLDSLPPGPASSGLAESRCSQSSRSTARDRRLRRTAFDPGRSCISLP